MLDVLCHASVYALFAVGFALTYRVTRAFNFAHPASFSCGAFAVLAFARIGYPWWLAIVDGAIAGAAAGLCLSAVGLWPRRRRDGESRAIVAAIAVLGIASSTVVAHLGGLLAGRATKTPAFHAIRIAGAVVGAKVVALLAGIAALVAVFALLFGTRAGAAVRAVADDASEARALGIRLGAITGITLFACGFLGALAGIVAQSIPSAGSAPAVLLSALAAVVLGGLDSPFGALLGAVAVAILEFAAAATAASHVSRPLLDTGIVFLAIALLPKGMLPVRGLRAADA